MNFRELMHVRRSRMEDVVHAELNKNGWFPLTAKSFCLLSTVPDFYFPDQNLAVYLDGEKVHRNRIDRDENLRELLAKRHHVKVLSIPYKRYSKAKVVEIVTKILEALS